MFSCVSGFHVWPIFHLRSSKNISFPSGSATWTSVASCQWLVTDQPIWTSSPSFNVDTSKTKHPLITLEVPLQRLKKKVLCSTASLLKQHFVWRTLDCVDFKKESRQSNSEWFRTNRNKRFFHIGHDNCSEASMTDRHVEGHLEKRQWHWWIMRMRMRLSRI